MTPFSKCSQGRPTFHRGLNRRLACFFLGRGDSRGFGAHTLQVTSTQQGTCTVHATCTRCLHDLQGRMASPGGELHTRHTRRKHLAPCVHSACTCWPQPGQETMSPRSLSPQQPHAANSDAGVKNVNTPPWRCAESGAMSSEVAGGEGTSASGEVERNSQPLRVLPFLAARETWVANSSIPCSFR